MLEVSGKVELAIDIVRELRNCEDLVSCQVLADTLDVSYGYVAIVCSRLLEAGIIRSHRGRFGGFEMDREVVTLYDLIYAVTTTDKQFHESRETAKGAIKKLYKSIDKEASKIIIK